MSTDKELADALRAAFERKRYGDGPYDPDFDLFDVAAARLDAIDAAGEGLETTEEERASRRDCADVYEARATRDIDRQAATITTLRAEIERKDTALADANLIISRMQFFTHAEARNGPNWERIMHIEAAVTAFRDALNPETKP